MTSPRSFHGRRLSTTLLVAVSGLVSLTLSACVPPTGLGVSQTLRGNLYQLRAVSGPIGASTVALTFDDGPNPRYTPQVLDVLDRYGVKATFFVIGKQAARYPDLDREIVRRGHAISNHTWDHASLPSLSVPRIDAEIFRTDDLIVQTTGRRPTCVRPPGGAVNGKVTARIAGSSHFPVAWSVDPRDWQRPGVAAITNRVLQAVRPGSIILLHDGGGDRSQTVAALPFLIQALRNRGYDFVSTCIPFDLTASPTSTTTPTAAPRP